MAGSFNYNVRGHPIAGDLSAIFRAASPLGLGFGEAQSGDAQTREAYIEQFRSLPEARRLRNGGFLGEVIYIHDHKKAKSAWNARLGENSGLLEVERFSGEHLSGLSPTIAETFPGLRANTRGEIMTPQDVIIWPSFFTSGLVMNDHDALATIRLHEFQHVKDLQSIERRMHAAGDSQRVMHAVAEIRATHASLTGAIGGRLPVSIAFLFEQSKSHFLYLEDFNKLEKSSTARRAVTSLTGLRIERDWVLDREPRGIRYTLVFQPKEEKMTVELTAPVESEAGWSEVLRG